MNRFLGDKFTIGGEVAATAGPVGRESSANTDVLLRAEILSWSRSRGLFAGLSLEGATLRPDSDENSKRLDATLPTKGSWSQIFRLLPLFADLSRRWTTTLAQSSSKNCISLGDRAIDFAIGRFAIPRGVEQILWEVAWPAEVRVL